MATLRCTGEQTLTVVVCQRCMGEAFNAVCSNSSVVIIMKFFN